LGLGFGLETCGLGLGLGLATYGLGLGLDTSALELDFQGILHFSLMKNPDSQSEILNHLL